MRFFAPISLLLAFALLGSGCFGPRMYSDDELAAMSDEDKTKAMELMLKEYPAPTFDAGTQAAQRRAAIDVMQRGTPERLASFAAYTGQAKGQARIVKEGDTYRLVLSEDFSVTPSPDAVVRVGSLEVGPLRSVKGVQSYDLPKGFSLTQASDVNIFCKPFKQMMAIAAFGAE